MDGLLCPKIAGLVRLTQRLKAKIQKKDDRKDLCPICGGKSNKGNLCRACFMRSFKPIAYTRNIKVVEQNEFFYGSGKDRRWERKMRAQATSATVDKDILNLVLTSRETVESSSSEISVHADGSGELELEKTSDQPSAATPTKLASIDQEPLQQVPSRELFKVELDVNFSTETQSMSKPCSPFVPGFWESPPEDIQPNMASKLKTFTDHVIKEARCPFKGIFCDSATDVGLDIRLAHEKTSSGPSKFGDRVHQNVQESFNQPSSMCCQSNMQTQCGLLPTDDRDRVTFTKQMKQNAIVELLQIAFRTNVILNSLYQYFKKLVETDGNSSENSESNPNDRIQATGSKISVDSFFFPNRQNTVVWGQTESNSDFEQNSDTEVISKSQATLSMLMAPFKNEQSHYECQENDSDGYTLSGPSTKFLLMTPLNEPTDRLATRKFHSEHSKLKLKPDSECKDGGFRESSVLITDDAVTEDKGNHAHGDVNIAQDPNSSSTSSGKSLLDLVFGLNRTCVKPSLVPLPECQLDLITLSSPAPSKDDVSEKTSKDADSQTALSSQHLEKEMTHLHKAFLDQLARFSTQLVDSCKTFGHSWQTSFLAELVEHFRSACSIISSAIGESCLAVPSSDRLDELQDVSNQISVCLARLRAHPHSFMGDCSDHDISTLLSSPADPNVGSTWV